MKCPGYINAPDEIRLDVCLPRSGGREMPYWQLFYHVVWATKRRTPLLTPEIAALTHDLLRQKALALEARVFAINGVEDHVHMVVVTCHRNPGPSVQLDSRSGA
jgi:REP element-mobilizing transposase RayT